ncbi:MAG: site-specific integrase [Pseudohongiella sp.]|uniref:tyrosine-type recombinase/integrase n=1 Tax=Pseudohongiella sp. TaxID=1979412 RepID=UPI0034A046FD
MKQAKVLNQDELKRLLKIVKVTRYQDRNRLVVLLSFLAGLRACEIAQLKVKDVLSVRDDIVEVKDTIYLKSYQTKGSSDQQVVVNETLRKEIGLYISKNPQLLKNREGFLLRSQKTCEGFSSQTIQNLFRTLYKEAGIENASSHSGRRSFITNLSEKGVSVRVIQELARHASMVTTQKYIEISAGKLRNAVDLVGI